MIALTKANEVLDIEKNLANLLSVFTITERPNLILIVSYLAQDHVPLFIDHSCLMKYSTKSDWTLQNPGEESNLRLKKQLAIFLQINCRKMAQVDEF